MKFRTYKLKTTLKKNMSVPFHKIYYDLYLYVKIYNFIIYGQRIPNSKRGKNDTQTNFIWKNSNDCAHKIIETIWCNGWFSKNFTSTKKRERVECFRFNRITLQMNSISSLDITHTFSNALCLFKEILFFVAEMKSRRRNSISWFYDIIKLG